MIFIKNGFVKTTAGSDIENGCILPDDNGKIADKLARYDYPALVAPLRHQEKA